MSYRQRARALKPLDPSLRDQEAAIRMGWHAMRALERRWDEGRDQFRAAEELSPDLGGQYLLLARRSLFEAEASQRDESDRYLRRPRLLCPSPRRSGWFWQSSRPGIK